MAVCPGCEPVTFLARAVEEGVRFEPASEAALLLTAASALHVVA